MKMYYHVSQARQLFLHALSPGSQGSLLIRRMLNSLPRWTFQNHQGKNSIYVRIFLHRLYLNKIKQLIRINYVDSLI